MRRLLGLSVAACLVLSGCMSSDGTDGGDSGDASAFVTKVDAHAQSVASDLHLLLTKMVDSDATGDYVDVASNAETLHDNMGQFRDEILQAADVDSSDEDAFITAENDLKSGVGTVIRWSDDPTSASLTARWAREIGTGVAEWNAAVRKLWAQAGETAPTIKIPKS